MNFLTKNELDLLEETFECPKCITSENICNHHTITIKAILIKDTIIEIEKLTATNSIR